MAALRLDQLGILVEGTLKIEARVLGLVRTLDQEVRFWLLGSAKSFIGSEPIYVAKVLGLPWIPEHVTVGGGVTKATISIKLNGRIRVFGRSASPAQIVDDKTGP